MLLFRWHSYIFPANVYYSIKINREERTAICVPKDRDRGWKSVTRLSIVFLQVYNGEAGRILRFNNAPLSSNSFPSRVFFFSVIVSTRKSENDTGIIFWLQERNILCSLVELFFSAEFHPFKYQRRTRPQRTEYKW